MVLDLAHLGLLYFDNVNETFVDLYVSSSNYLHCLAAAPSCVLAVSVDVKRYSR
jgi:hypothetical protein